MSRAPLIIAAFILISFPARDAYAYIDPGTGSFIFQMVVASILGAVLTIKLWLGAAKQFFGRFAGSGGKGASADAGMAELPPSEADAADKKDPTEGA